MTERRTTGKHLSGQAAEIARRVKVTVLSVLPDATVILYGSRARRDARPDSDWDFLVLTDEPVTGALVESVRNIVYDIALEFEEVISVFIENRSDWFSPLGQALPLNENVTLEGITV